MPETSSPFPADKGLKKPVCVFCGSSPGSLSLYSNAAKAVGRALAENNIPLIYGGGRRGIMGVVSSAVLEAGGYVHGVIPKSLVERASEQTPAPSSNEGVKSQEGQGGDLLEKKEEEYKGRMTTEVTISMHERKMKMAQYSTGGFICLPGGYGTFEEMMEMITWNQLGIHSLPVLVLNIGNFYAPVRSLFEGAVAAGFIQEKNLALVTIVDLEGGKSGSKAANFEESIADQWGPAAIKALNEWTLPGNAGYGLKWDEKENCVVEKKADMDTPSSPGSSKSPTPDFSLFTTMRYTNPTQPSEVMEDMIPLWPYHPERLRQAHAHFSRRDEGEKWGTWPGDEAVWVKVKEKLEKTDKGDWRVRLLLHPRAGIEVQALPAPGDAGPFTLLPTSEKGKGRALILDPETTDLTTETKEKIDLRLYKTTNRSIYDQATARASKITPGAEVLLHTKAHLLETSTSNIAIQSPTGEWITPTLNERTSPFLDGVMRRCLLHEGIIREGEVTVSDFEEAKKEGRRVIGFNGLRGVWEAELL